MATPEKGGGLEQRKKTLKLGCPWTADNKRAEIRKGGWLLQRKKLRRVVRRGRWPCVSSTDEAWCPQNVANPGSAAGCNKPAGSETEKSVKAARNREGETGPVPWQGQAEATLSMDANP